MALPENFSLYPELTDRPIVLPNDEPVVVPLDNEDSSVNHDSWRGPDGQLPQKKINAGSIKHRVDKPHAYHKRGKSTFDRD